MNVWLKRPLNPLKIDALILVPVCLKVLLLVYLLENRGSRMRC